MKYTSHVPLNAIWRYTVTKELKLMENYWSDPAIHIVLFTIKQEEFSRFLCSFKTPENQAKSLLVTSSDCVYQTQKRNSKIFILMNSLIPPQPPKSCFGFFFNSQWSPWRPDFESLCVGPWEPHSDGSRLLLVLAVLEYCLSLAESLTIRSTQTEISVILQENSNRT